MFYDYELKIAFIHIPRTGGTSISYAFKPFIGLGGGWDLGALRHLTAKRMKQLIGEKGWDRLYKFSVVRPVKEIKKSHVKLILRDIKLLEKDKFTTTWLLNIQKAQRIIYDTLGYIPKQEEELTDTLVDNIVSVTYPDMLYFCQSDEKLKEYWFDVENVDVYNYKDLFSSDYIISHTTWCNLLKKCNIPIYIPLPHINRN